MKDVQRQVHNKIEVVAYKIKSGVFRKLLVAYIDEEIYENIRYREG